MSKLQKKLNCNNSTMDECEVEEGKVEMRLI